MTHFIAINLSITRASVTAALAWHTICISHSLKDAEFLINIYCCWLGGDIEELNWHTELEPNLVFGTLWLKIQTIHGAELESLTKLVLTWAK